MSPELKISSLALLTQIIFISCLLYQHRELNYKRIRTNKTINMTQSSDALINSIA